jgi:glycosyltransferase involved in cell wall biosynthesis
MKLSVIIPTYNEEKVIRNCLNSLLEQTYKNFEVILVDDGSTDCTEKIAKVFKAKEYEIKIFRQNHKGPGAARNLAAKEAIGDILVFVDADMTFDENFLEKLVGPIIEGKEKGTFSKNEYVANWDNVWARCWNINEGWEEKRRHPKNYPDRQKVFRAIFKNEFIKVGGFTPGGYNDDWSLSEKLGYDAGNAPGAIFYHANPSSLHEVFFHAKWVGKRPYKLGILGKGFALLRASLPISILIGTLKSIIFLTPLFLIFKILYDAGIFFGILESIFTNKLSK